MRARSMGGKRINSHFCNCFDDRRGVSKQCVQQYEHHLATKPHQMRKLTHNYTNHQPFRRYASIQYAWHLVSIYRELLVGSQMDGDGARLTCFVYVSYHSGIPVHTYNNSSRPIF